MKFVDLAGNQLEEGTPVCLPMDFLKGIQGNIVKLESGLGASGQDAIPKIAVMFVIPLQVAPNGMVPGVFAMPKPEVPSGLVA